MSTYSMMCKCNLHFRILIQPALGHGPRWGLSCQSQQTVTPFMQATTLWCLQGGSFGLASIPNPPWGLGIYMYCEPPQNAIAATGSQQFANVMHTWPYCSGGWWIVWNCRHACALCHPTGKCIYSCSDVLEESTDDFSCIMHGSG